MFSLITIFDFSLTHKKIQGGGQVLLVETCRILLDYCLLQVERNKEIRNNDSSNLERAVSDTHLM